MMRYVMCDKCYRLSRVPSTPQMLIKTSGWLEVGVQGWTDSKTILNPHYPIEGKTHLLCAECARKWKESNE